MNCIYEHEEKLLCIKCYYLNLFTVIRYIGNGIPKMLVEFTWKTVTLVLRKDDTIREAKRKNA